MAVDEELATRSKHTRGFREQHLQALARHMLDDIERIRLRKRLVRKRQPPQIAQRQVRLFKGLVREKRAGIDAHLIRIGTVPMLAGVSVFALQSPSPRAKAFVTELRARDPEFVADTAELLELEK